jgi:hypothetical protein
MFQYQIALLGRVPTVATGIRRRIEQTADDLGLPASSLRILEEHEAGTRNRKSPLVAVFFGYAGATDSGHPIVQEIHADSLPIIPAVETLDGFQRQVPNTIAGVNGLRIQTEADVARLVSTIFENLHLLRSERRLFISYRRAESTGVAIQLFEALDERGFDVFLDTRSVSPGVDFQAELWHRLADSDVVVLLDTPQFRISHWTVQELAQANATSIQLLHLLWPGVPADPTSAFSEFRQMDVGDFRSGSAPDADSKLSDNSLLRVCEAVESLRARALAARHAYLVDYFCDLANANGLTPNVHPQRYVSVQIGGKEHAIFPAVGVPTAPRLETFEQAVKDLDPTPIVRVIYDERGILDRWKVHLGWLSAHLPVKAVQVSRLPDAFASGDI